MEPTFTNEKKQAAPPISEAEARRRHLLSDKDLCRMRLMPTGAPVALMEDGEGNVIYYYNPAKTTSKWIYSRPVVTTIGAHVFAK